MDCFVPSSILLGPVDKPIEPQNQCTLTNIANDDDDIKACLCTSPLCNLAKTSSTELKQSPTNTNDPPEEKRIPTSGNTTIFPIMHDIVSQMIWLVISILHFCKARQNTIPKRQISNKKDIVPAKRNSLDSSKYLCTQM